MKHKISYTVRTTRAPGETEDSTIPAIVDRRQPTELAAVIENCIDRGLIAGLKPSAAEGIAEGIAQQLAYEFARGRSVSFGRYFYGRPYLSGTVDANGRLTAANGVNVRLYKGEDFKLTLDDFSFTFEDGGNAPKIDWLISAGNGVRNELVAGSAVSANGRMLHLADDTNAVAFTEVGAASGTPIVVRAFQSAGPDLLSFDWPQGLETGKRYSVVATRTDVNGVTRTTPAKTVAVKAGAVPPGPEPVGAPGIEEAQSTGQNPGVVNLHGDLTVKGQNLETATAVELCDEHQEAFATVPVAWDAANGRLYAEAISFTGENPGIGYLKVTTAGGTDSFGVEFVSA